MLSITIPTGDLRTRYIVETVFSDWFGLKLVLRTHKKRAVTIACGEEPPLTFEPVGKAEVALARQLAVHPIELEKKIQLWKMAGAELRPISGPILSAMFHVLAGTEELDTSRFDHHGRFPASSSALFKAGYGDAPFVDLWSEAIWSAMISRWPSLTRVTKTPKLNVTHDVDAPFQYAFKGPLEVTRSMLGGAAQARSLRGLGSSLARWRKVRHGDPAADPYNQFDWMMSQAELVGRQCTFYVIAGKTAGRIDGDYDVEHPIMIELWSAIIERGHKLALHPSYHCFRSRSALRKEKERLDQLLDRLGVSASADVRMHYLRFDPLRTPSLLQAVGFSRDSSLGFADRHGFRRGTCRPFRLWDLEAARPLRLIESPLLIMDASLFASRYQSFGPEQAEAAFTNLTSWCKRMGGELTMLWHNNFFAKQWHFDLYERCLGQWRGV